VKNIISIQQVERHIDRYIENKKPQKEILINHRRLIKIKKNHLNLKNSDVIKNIRYCNIFFVADRPNHFFLRVSKSMKKKGIKTCLITRWGISNQERNFFDEIVLYDSFYDLKKIEELKKKKFYVQQWTGYNFLGVYIFLINKQTSCNINDLTKFLVKKKKDYRRLGLQKKEVEFELKCEKYILENAKLVTHFYHDSVFSKFENNIKKRVNKNIIYFPSYPLKDFFFNKKRDKPKNKVNFLYPGMVRDDTKSKAFFSDSRLDGTREVITKKKFYLFIYNNPQIYLNNKNLNFYLEKEAKKNKFLSFQKGYQPWHLKRYTKKFHFGTMPFYYNKFFTSEMLHGPMGTKIFTYIEQCLPFIVTYKTKAQSDFVNKYKVGFTLNSRQDILNLDRILKTNLKNYPKFIENIKNFRKKFSMDVMVNIIIKKIGITK